MARVISFQKFKDRKTAGEKELTEYDKRQRSIRRLLGYADEFDWGNDGETDDES